MTCDMRQQPRFSHSQPNPPALPQASVPHMTFPWERRKSRRFSLSSRTHAQRTEGPACPRHSRECAALVSSPRATRAGRSGGGRSSGRPFRPVIPAKAGSASQQPKAGHPCCQRLRADRILRSRLCVTCSWVDDPAYSLFGEVFPQLIPGARVALTRATRYLLATLFVGWVERSDTHHRTTESAVKSENRH